MRSAVYLLLLVIVIVVVAASIIRQQQVHEHVHSQRAVRKRRHTGDHHGDPYFEVYPDNRTTHPPPWYAYKPMTGIDEILNKIFSVFMDVPTSNELGARAEFAAYALQDSSNDHLHNATAEAIILEAGFDYESYYVEATDGYITQLVRIINPLADQSKLKQPPVAMYHGAIADTAMYITSSSVQHHPEKWPRNVDVDGPITSWNRSLGFYLANNGYDVWLVGTRGCNQANQGHKHLKKPWTILRPDLSMNDLDAVFKYWSNMTLDDIAEKEVPAQLGKIMKVTGAPKVSIISYSMSTLITLNYMQSNPSHSAKVHNYIQLAPLLTENNSNNLQKFLYRTFFSLEPNLGSLLLAEMILSQPARDFSLAIAGPLLTRYTIIRPVITLILGPTPKYSTLYEINFIGHNGAPVGFKEEQHMSQILRARRLQRYDYGNPLDNMAHYGTPQPPEFKLHNIRPANWLIVSAEHDPYSTREDVQDYIAKVGKKPYRHLYVRRANHVDLIYMTDNDHVVNRPILQFLDRFPLKSKRGSDHTGELITIDLPDRSRGG